MINIGDKVKISYINSMTKEEQIKIYNLNFIVTIEDINENGGFYSKEFEGYLFTFNQIN